VRVEKNSGKTSKARAVASGASYCPLVVPPLLSRHEGISCAVAGLVIKSAAEV